MQSRPASGVLTTRQSCERLLADRAPCGTRRGVLLNCDAVLMDNNVPRVTTVDCGSSLSTISFCEPAVTAAASNSLGLINRIRGGHGAFVTMHVWCDFIPF